MSIIYRKGNIVEAFKNNEIDILVHGVNCQGVMNSGIAKEIRKEFPEVFKNYKFYVEVNTRDCSNCNDCCVCGSSSNKTENMLGDIQSVRIDNGFKFIVNAFTQLNYGYDTGTKYCNYDAIEKTMKQINKEVVGNVVIGMPKIGSKRGGGDWNVIEAIINSVFNDRDVFVYTLD